MWRTVDENLLAPDVVEVLQNDVNDTIYEEITETVDISQESEQEIMNLFKNKRSVVFLK